MHHFKVKIPKIAPPAVSPVGNGTRPLHRTYPLRRLQPLMTHSSELRSRFCALVVSTSLRTECLRKTRPKERKQR